MATSVLPKKKTIECIEIILGRRQVELFHENNVLFIEYLIKFDSGRKILNEAYRSLSIRNMIVAIEDMPVDQKTQLWESAKELGANKIEKQKAIEFVKALYTMEYFLNEV